MLTWPIATATPTDHTGPTLPTSLLKEPALLPCLPFLSKTASPGLICLHCVFADPCFTLRYSFDCASVCLPSIKAAAKLFFVKLIYENFFHFKHGFSIAHFPFPRGSDCWVWHVSRHSPQQLGYGSRGEAPASSFISCTSSQPIFYQQLLVNHRDRY